MTEDRHARDANILLTADGLTTSPCKYQGLHVLVDSVDEQLSDADKLTGESLSRKISSLISG